VLSKLLADDQFLSLITKYAEEFSTSLAQYNVSPSNGNGHANGYTNGYAAGSNGSIRNGSQPRYGDADEDMKRLHERVQAMEAQQQAHKRCLKFCASRFAAGSGPGMLSGVRRWHRRMSEVSGTEPGWSVPARRNTAESTCYRSTHRPWNSVQEQREETIAIHFTVRKSLCNEEEENKKCQKKW
jgi:hypothetical protein